MQAEMTQHLGYEKHDGPATTAATRVTARQPKRYKVTSETGAGDAAGSKWDVRA